MALCVRDASHAAVITRPYVQRCTPALHGTTGAQTVAKHKATLSAAKGRHTQGQRRAFSHERLRAQACVHSRATKSARLRPQAQALRRSFPCSARVPQVGPVRQLPCKKNPHGNRQTGQGARGSVPCGGHRRHAQTPHIQLGGLCALCHIQTEKTWEELGEEVHVSCQTSHGRFAVMSALFARESIHSRVYDAANPPALLRSRLEPGGTLSPLWQ